MRLRTPVQGWSLHSDQGRQYAHKAFRQRLAEREQKPKQLHQLHRRFCQRQAALPTWGPRIGYENTASTTLRGPRHGREAAGHLHRLRGPDQHLRRTRSMKYALLADRIGTSPADVAAEETRMRQKTARPSGSRRRHRGRSVRPWALGLAQRKEARAVDGVARNDPVRSSSSHRKLDSPQAGVLITATR